MNPEGFRGRHRQRSGAPVALAAAFLLAACGSGAEPAGKDKNRGPSAVGFVVAQPGPVPIQTTLAGRVSAFRTAEVRPQVSGLIRRRLFTEGSMVRQGQPLYQIDPSLYRAAVAQASANLSSASASAEAAQVRADRYKPLAAAEAISQQEYTDAVAQARQARAAVAQNRAAVDTARINLRFTTVPAPISGRIGRSLATEGALVTGNQADPLAVISTLDPVYVDIQQSSAELVTLRRTLASGGTSPGSTAVRLQLEDGSDYGMVGTVQFSEMTVNEATGTVTLRARFPNPGGVLFPGMFVRASFVQAVDPAAYLIPQAALQRDFGGDAFVYLVGADSKVVRRKVEAPRTSGTAWVVTAGLQPGDRVITQGINNLKQGAPVRATPATTRPAATAADEGAAGRATSAPGAGGS